MIKKVLLATALGVITWFSLLAVPYFPKLWVACLSVVVLLVGMYSFGSAVSIATGVLALSLAYHSAALCIVFLLTAGIFTTLLSTFSAFPEAFLIVAATPLASGFELFGLYLPLGFLAVFLAPIFLKGREIPIVASTACLWTLLVGIFAHQPFMGHLLIGPAASALRFFTIMQPPGDFIQLGWLLGRLNLSLLQELWSVGSGLVTFFLSSPQALIQVLGWAIASSLCGILLAKKTLRLDLAATLACAVALLALELVVASLFKLKLDIFQFLLGTTPPLLACFGLLQVGRRIERKKKPAGLAAQAAGLGERKLSLEETLKIQAQLQDYLKTQFVHEVTAVDIDIADSTKLKEGEKPETVIYCFSEYWKFVDKIMKEKQGQLLNRAGDGAIYLFPDPDQAVSAAKEILQKLGAFNQTVNRLKQPIQIRTGLHTGEIMADKAKKTGDVFSRALDLSGHLQKMGAPGQIYISEHTHQKLKDKTGFERGGRSERDNIDVYVLKVF